MEKLLQHQHDTLQANFSSPENFRQSEGGHMSYNRCLFDENPGRTHFVKAHNPSFFDEEWREQEMIGFLDKEGRVYDHLRANNYPYIPEYSSYHDDMLVLNGLIASEGWYWRAPEEVKHEEQYTTDILTALQELEQVTPAPREELDEVSVDVFYDHGWDKLHDIDISKLVSTNLDRWQDTLRPELIVSAEQLLLNLGELSVKRASVGTSIFNHHDARQSNIAWHPEKGVAIVDWSWADNGLPGGDPTMFLLDLAKSEKNIDKYMDYFNPTYAKMIMGYWLQRSQSQHAEGNQIVRMQQFISAIKASEVLLKHF